MGSYSGPAGGLPKQLPFFQITSTGIVAGSTTTTTEIGRVTVPLSFITTLPVQGGAGLFAVLLQALIQLDILTNTVGSATNLIVDFSLDGGATFTNLFLSSILGVYVNVSKNYAGGTLNIVGTSATPPTSIILRASLDALSAGTLTIKNYRLDAFLQIFK